MSLRRAFFAALAGLQITGPLPLRELFFDDTNREFHTYTPYSATEPAGAANTWASATDPNYPGGLRQNTVTICGAVQDQDLVCRITFSTTGTIEEGPVFNLVNEPGGPLEVWVNGQLLGTLNVVSYYDRLLTQVYDMRRVGAKGGAVSLQFGNGTNDFLLETLFPAGTHTVELRKVRNETGTNTSPGNRVTYYDGVTVFTRANSFIQRWFNFLV